MMETKTGGCHCKNIRYEVRIDLSQPVIECNCSHCQIKGLLLAFVPENDFTMTQGDGELTEYRFNTNKIQHLFCKKCGVQAFGKGENGGNKMSAVNVRTIDGIDLSTLNRVPYNGKDI
jgi:hypothetical protein